MLFTGECVQRVHRMNHHFSPSVSGQRTGTLSAKLSSKNADYGTVKYCSCILSAPGLDSIVLPGKSTLR